MQFWWSVVVWLFCVLGLPFSLRADIPIQVKIEIADTVGHYFAVEVSAESDGADSLDFKMPVWIPGSYLIREFERNVVDFRAVSKIGTPLLWRKVNKNTWRVYPAGYQRVAVRYRVYAFDSSIRASYLDADRAFINPSSVCMFVEGKIFAPYHVELHFPENWKRISTALQQIRSFPPTFLALDYDELVDSPIEIGNQRVIKFTQDNVQYEIAVTGSGNVEPDTLVPYFEKIVRVTTEIMQQIPFDRYVFFLQLRAQGGGGLEHRNSCVLQASRWSFRPYSRFRRFLGLVAHEFFHAWNVKAFKPYPLGPFNYDAENYTRLLWIAEGFTSYYSPRILLKAGLLKEKDYLRRIETGIEQLERTPGRHHQSLTEASFDTWIKFYRPDENSRNVTVSYYSKGALVGMLLDLYIRKETQNLHSLDDVMRILYERYYLVNPRTYTYENFKNVCAEVSGGDLTQFFADYVEGTEELDFSEYLEFAGLELLAEERGKQAENPEVGFSWREEGGRIIVTEVLDQSPAYHMGLSARDELIAIDAFRLTRHNLNSIFATLRPGEWHVVTLSRDGNLRRLNFEYAEWHPPDYRLKKMDQRTDEQVAIYRSWIYQQE